MSGDGCASSYGEKYSLQYRHSKTYGSFSFVSQQAKDNQKMGPKKSSKFFEIFKILGIFEIFEIFEISKISEMARPRNAKAKKG